MKNKNKFLGRIEEPDTPVEAVDPYDGSPNLSEINVTVGSPQKYEGLSTQHSSRLNQLRGYYNRKLIPHFESQGFSPHRAAERADKWWEDSHPDSYREFKSLGKVPSGPAPGSTHIPPDPFMVGNSALAEGYEAIKGRPYNFLNTIHGDRQRTLGEVTGAHAMGEAHTILNKAMGQPFPSLNMSNIVGLGLDMADPAIVAGGIGGAGLVGKLSKVDKALDFTKVGSKVLNKTDDVVKNLPKLEQIPVEYSKIEDLIKNFTAKSDIDKKNSLIMKEGNKYFKELNNPESLKRLKKFGDEYDIDLLDAYKKAEERWDYGTNIGQHSKFKVKDLPEGVGGRSAATWGYEDNIQEFYLINKYGKDSKQVKNFKQKLNQDKSVNYISPKIEMDDYPRVIWHELSHDINKAIIKDSPKLKKDISDIFINDVRRILDDDKPISLMAESKGKSLKDYKLDYITNPTETWAFLSTNLRQDLKNTGLIKDYNQILTPEILEQAVKNGNTTFSRFEPYIKDKDKFIKLFNKMTLSMAPAALYFQSQQSNENSGMFDMTNPNIYKSILPPAFIIGARAINQSQNKNPMQYRKGGFIPKYNEGGSSFKCPEGYYYDSNEEVCIPFAQSSAKKGLESVREHLGPLATSVGINTMARAENPGMGMAGGISAGYGIGGGLGALAGGGLGAIMGLKNKSERLTGEFNAMQTKLSNATIPPSRGYMAPLAKQGGLSQIIGTQDDSFFGNGNPDSPLTLNDAGMPLVLTPGSNTPIVGIPNVNTFRGDLSSLNEDVPLAQQGMKNAPSQEEMPRPIQAEKGEKIATFDGEIFDVNATKSHKEMGKDDITDILPPSSYVFSKDKSMLLSKDKADKMVLGIKPMEYGSDSRSKYEETTLGDYFTKSKQTPAEVAQNIKNRFKSDTNEEGDPFITITGQENKSGRIAPLTALIQYSEEKKNKGKPKETKQEAVEEVPKMRTQGVPPTSAFPMLNKWYKGFGSEAEIIAPRNLPNITGMISPVHNEYSANNPNRFITDTSVHGAKVPENIPVQNKNQGSSPSHDNVPFTGNAEKRSAVDSDSSLTLSDRTKEDIDSLERELQESLDRTKNIYNRSRRGLGAGTLGAIAGYASQDPTVEAPNISDRYIDQMPRRVPEQIPAYQRQMYNESTRPIVREMFENSPQFSRVASQLSTLPAGLSRGQSDLAAKIAQNNLAMEGQYLNAKHANMAGNEQAAVQARNLTNANINKTLAGITGVGVNHTNMATRLSNDYERSIAYHTALNNAKRKQMSYDELKREELDRIFPPEDTTTPDPEVDESEPYSSLSLQIDPPSLVEYNKRNKRKGSQKFPYLF